MNLEELQKVINDWSEAFRKFMDRANKIIEAFRKTEVNNATVISSVKYARPSFSNHPKGLYLKGYTYIPVVHKNLPYQRRRF